MVLRDYDRNSKNNAYLMSAAIELVRNSYSQRILGSETLGTALSFFRNATTDIIDSSEYMKYNFMSYASGNATHPNNYEWELK
jgi:hypothetical protein